MSRGMTMTEAELAAHYAKHGFAHAPAQAMPSNLPERALLAQVRRLAKDQGYMIYHTHRSEKSEPGFPDLVLSKPGRLLFIELKSDRGKLTVDQMQWLEVLKRSVPGVETYCWRPSDLEEIVSVLSRKATP